MEIMVYYLLWVMQDLYHHPEESEDKAVSFWGGLAIANLNRNPAP